MQKKYDYPKIVFIFIMKNIVSFDLGMKYELLSEKTLKNTQTKKGTWFATSRIYTVLRIRNFRLN